MHVFIDTNILLNFYHFTKEDLDALNTVFGTHENGSATVHLTQQVKDEFSRNRERKIKDALRRFNDAQIQVQLPSFMKAYDEYTEIKNLLTQLQNKIKVIRNKTDDDISEKVLLADNLIGEIFEKSTIIGTTKTIVETASMRMAIGNPPGKNSSIGDAINWIALLESVPTGENLHIITEDSDFYSCLCDNNAHPFLEEEWVENKNSSLRVYRTLSRFLGEHFDGIAFSYDKKKEGLIEGLSNSGSFASTHIIVDKLDKYGYFSLKEIEGILRAAIHNDQFGAIVTDYDVSDFLNRVAIPRITEILKPEYIEILDKVKKEKAERANN